MSNFIQVDNLNILNNLRNHEEGEVAYLKDENKYYIYRDDEWTEIEPSQELVGINLYEMNKMILGQLAPLTEKEIAEAKEVIRNYVHDKNHADDYYMLLCHDLKYFSVFVSDKNENETIDNALLECLNCVGNVKSINLTDDKGAIEIWVTTPEEETCVMYFFDYGRGIVPCRI
jgi:hypothetical protein